METIKNTSTCLHSNCTNKFFKIKKVRRAERSEAMGLLWRRGFWSHFWHQICIKVFLQDARSKQRNIVLNTKIILQIDLCMRVNSRLSSRTALCRTQRSETFFHFTDLTTFQPKLQHFFNFTVKTKIKWQKNNWDTLLVCTYLFNWYIWRQIVFICMSSSKAILVGRMSSVGKSHIFKDKRSTFWCLWHKRRDFCRNIWHHWRNLFL